MVVEDICCMLGFLFFCICFLKKSLTFFWSDLPFHVPTSNFDEDPICQFIFSF